MGGHLTARDPGVPTSRALWSRSGDREWSARGAGRDHACCPMSVALEENIYRSRILVAKRESNGSHGDIRFDLPRKTAKPLDLS